MAFKTRDYASGDVFVPGTAFGESKLFGKGPSEPTPTDVGPIAVHTFAGPAFGDVRYQDGARTMDNQKPSFKGKLKPADNHLPENA